MNKDKEWLKQQAIKNYPSQSEINNPDYVVITKVEIIDEFLSSIDQLEEPKITEEQAWDKISESYPADAKSLSVAFEHFYYEGFAKKEKPVIPQFVADYIEKWKDQGLAMYEWFAFNFDNKEDEEVNKWLYDNEYEENTRREHLLIDAVRYGYEVEKEPQWVVLRNCMYIKNFYFGEMNNDYRVGSIAYKEQAMVFTDKAKAEAVALLVDGEVEGVTE